MSETIKNKKFGLNNNQLKIIAMISMLIDHTGLMFFPYDDIFRIIGRLAFPIYAYMIAEGCKYTRNRKKYLLVIAVMAFVYQIVYYVFSDTLYQGILVTFSLSIGIIFSVEGIKKNRGARRILMIFTLLTLLFVGIVLPYLFTAKDFAFDYGIWGIFLPVIIYFIPKKNYKVLFTLIFLIVMSIFSHPNQWWAIASVPLLALYNGERGSAKLKYLFYIFYPLHLVLLTAINIILVLLA